MEVTNIIEHLIESDNNHIIMKYAKGKNKLKGRYLFIYKILKFFKIKK